MIGAMKRIDHEAGRLPADRFRLLDREEATSLGATDRMISGRLANGRWVRVHPGVYQIGPASDEWLTKLRAAVLAAGEGAAISHRAAFALWGLDGLETGIVEITVPYTHQPLPAGVIVHRTRRTLPKTELHGVVVTPVERTLLDAAGLLPRMVVAKGLDSALRRNLTSVPRLLETIEEQAGRGVPGTKPLTSLVSALEVSGATGSPAETELLHLMRKAGLPDPVLQYEVMLPDGRRYVVDFGWPSLGKGVEVDGLDAHAGAELLERDLQRQNAHHGHRARAPPLHRSGGAPRRCADPHRMTSRRR